MRRNPVTLLLAALVALAGCVGGEPEPLPPNETPDVVVETPLETPPAEPAVQSEPEAVSEPEPPAAEPASEADTERQKADVGVGKRGRDYGQGPVSTPVAAYFSIQERLIFQQVLQAVQLYVAENGRAPKTHDEFMKQIIKANRLELPELPDGARYVYLPDKVNLPEDTGLWVERTEK